MSFKFKGKLKRTTVLRMRPVDRQQNKKIKSLNTQVKRLAKADEKKYLDAGISQSVSTTVQKYPLNSMAVFAGDNNLRHTQRQGQSIVMTSLRIRGLVQILPDALSPDLNNRVRMMVVHTPDSSTPVNLSDILQKPTEIDSHYRIKPPEAYKILYDKTFNLQNIIPSAISGGTRNATATEKFRIPFKINLGKKAFGKSGTKSTWIVGAGAVAPSRGALTLMSFSDSGTVSHPAVEAQSRLRFLDN